MTTQIELLNRLANDPAILPHVAPGMDRVYMDAFFDHPGNLLLGDEDGALLFGMVSPGVYEGHYLFPSTSHVNKIARSRALISCLFTDHYADAIVGHTPVEDLPARVMSRALGFTRRGTSVSITGRSCVDYVLERREWETLSGASSGAWARSSERKSKPTQPQPPARTP